VIAIVYLILSGFLVYVAARRATLIAPVTVWNLYLFLSLLVYEWIVLTGLSRKESVFSSMPLDLVAIPYHTTYLFFLAMQLFALTALIGLPKPKSWLFFDASSILKYAKYICGGSALLVLAGFWLLSAIHFASINLEVLWLNFEYKTIKDPVGIGATGVFARIYHFGFRFVGLAAVAAGVIYYHRGAWLHLILTLGLISYSLLFLLADNSRWVPVYFAAAAVVNYVVSKRPLGILTWLNSLLVFVTFAKVLSDRSNPQQGVSTIMEGFGNLSLSNLVAYIEGFFTNLFPAALNFANSVVIDGTHGVAYKIASFSPLPGFIDNFQAIDFKYQIKLAPTVPMGAYGEVYLFGWAYMLLFFSIAFYWLRIVTRLIINRLDASALILVILSYYFIVKLGSYAVRQSWRLMLIVIVVAVILEANRRSVARRESRRHRRLVAAQAAVSRSEA